MTTVASLADVGVQDFAADEAFARHLDAIDPLRGERELFACPAGPYDGRSIYLCGNSLGLMPKAARDEVLGELDDWSRLAVEGHAKARVP